MDAIEEFHFPLVDRPLVALDYRAQAPGLHALNLGGLLANSLDVRVQAHESRDFLLRDSSGVVFISAAGGVDVTAFHREQSARHGLNLRTQLRSIGAGDHIGVVGRVEILRSDAVAYRQEICALVRAKDIFPLEPSAFVSKARK